MKDTEHQIATSVLVIGTGGAGLRAAIELAERGRRRPRRRQAAQVGRAHQPRRRRHQRRAGDDGPRGLLAAARRRHPEGELPARGPAAPCEIVTEGAARGIADLERYGMPFAREADGRISQRFFGAHTYRRTAFAGDYTGLEIQRTLINRADAARHPDPRHRLHHADPGPGQRRLRRLRLRPRGRDAVRDPRRRRHPRRRWTHPDLAAHLLAPRREHRRLLPPGRAGRRPDPRRRARAVPSRPGSSSPENAAGTLVSEAARGEGGSPAQRTRRAVHDAATTPSGWSCPPATGSPWPAYTEIKEGRGTPNGGVWLDVSHLPRRDDHATAAPRLPDAAGAPDARHHPRADRDRADRALLDGRRLGAARKTTAPASKASTPSARPPAACTARTASAATP